MLSNFLEVLVLVVYSGSLLFLFVYSLVQLHLTWSYVKKGRVQQSDSLPSPENWPLVTIQLPIFNEPEVAARLIKQTADIRYPGNRLEIQVLDDSTDHTPQVVQETIKSLTTDISIKHIQRPSRKGFKAGALSYGLQTAMGELIAIFDADFMPGKDFLEKTVPHFNNAGIGVVQTRWGHLNQDYSLLTRTQAFGLDAHFTVEQRGRNLEGCFVSFNGTAGIWRKQCIDEAGGWQSDTLTEDLDLSYRAQLKGWRFVFLEDVVSPAELPITMGAYKSQQYRWNKGAAETHMKIWKEVTRAPLKLKVKFHALIQLMKGFGFVASFLLSIASVPIIYFGAHSQGTKTMMHILSFTLICILILTAFYYASLQKIKPVKRERRNYFLRRFPSFIAISMATACHNSMAVMEGYLGIKSPFVRTPKFNVVGTRKSKRLSVSFQQVSWLTLLEGLLAIYFAIAVYMGIQWGQYTFVPFHLLMFAGYFFLFTYTFRSTEAT